VTDGRQQLHFRQLFAAFRRWRPEASAPAGAYLVALILGEDGKPSKRARRDHSPLRILDEAEERAKVVMEKSPELPEIQKTKSRA
jgi:arginyl-tRNA synthetase